MECIRYITPLLLATAAFADYYVDNANSSVIYAMPATQSGQGWETFSVGTKSLALSFSNSTGNYTIPLDASHCYDENYALAVCGTVDNCFIQIPFVGSGITMYVFNAGLTGMSVSCSIDGGAGVTSSIQAPLPPTYQVSNVSLYDIQGLPTANHTIKMTLLDWNGGGTSMKFDYAHVNETFVAASVKTSSTSSMTSTSASETPTQTSAGNMASSHNVNVGGIIGAILGGLALCAVIVLGVLYWRRRQSARLSFPVTPESTFHVNPFTSEFGNGPPPSAPTVTPLHLSFSSQQPESTSSIPPLTRSAILRDALATSNYSSSGSGLDRSSQSVGSARDSAVFRPHHRQHSHGVDVDVHVRANPSHGADAGSPLPDSITSRYNLTAEQIEVVERLRRDGVPLDTISRVIEGLVSSNLGASDRKVRRERSVVSAAPPPSYQTRDG